MLIYQRVCWLLSEKTDADDLEWRTKSQDFREGSADLSFEHLIHMLQPDTMGLIRPSTSAKRNTNPETRQLTNIICARISISIAGIYWAYRKVCAELFVRALVIPCVNLCLYGFPLADASWPTAAESTPSNQLCFSNRSPSPWNGNVPIKSYKYELCHV